MLRKFTIYGERGSGTNYLEQIMKMNFNANLTWDYGWKHFFGFCDDKLNCSDDTLFICIVRNPVDWLNSLYRNPWHLPKNIKTTVNTFLNSEIYSHNHNFQWRHMYNDVKNVTKTKTEIMEDRNIYTGERYKNIFELRHTKMKWMIEDLPKKVKHYIFIKHEDLLYDFDNTLQKINEKGLEVKKNINFPLNTKTNFPLNRETNYIKKENLISDKLILSNPNYISFYDKKIYNI